LNFTIRLVFRLILTSLIARERGFSVDEKGFQEEMAKQKSRSKVDATKETGDWILVGSRCKNRIYRLRTVTVPRQKLLSTVRSNRRIKNSFNLVLDKTPFYAESGGQVGDTGFIENANEKIFITDTKKGK
jgi:alanyl-tRNA synthetase